MGRAAGRSRRRLSPEWADEIAAILREARVAADLVPPLSTYGAFVLEARLRFNLTSATTAAEVAAHVLDSLTVAPYIADPYVDVGSGAGFPAIPAAIVTATPVTLIEATAKKARFLASALDALKLTGSVLDERAERAARDDKLRESFASGTARAIGTASTVAELLLPFIAIDGVAVLQRGRTDAAELRSVEDAALMLGGELEGQRLTGEGDRRLIFIRKVRPTPARFPRRVGIPAKRPLCG